MSSVRRSLFASALVIGAVPAFAAPINLVTNGDFTQASFTKNSEFGASFGGQGVTGWKSDSAAAYNLYWVAGTQATVEATSRWSELGQKLATSVTASPAGGNFISMDGDGSVRGPVTQSIAGLTAGNRYDLSFFWGATQLQNRSGPTTEQLQVGLGGDIVQTGIKLVESQGFSGWIKETFTFAATSGSELLSFLSLGTPTGLPPMAVLDGVSLTASVPEPASLAVLGAGLLGVRYARRRLTLG